METSILGDGKWGPEALSAVRWHLRMGGWRTCKVACCSNTSKSNNQCLHEYKVVVNKRSLGTGLGTGVQAKVQASEDINRKQVCLYRKVATEIKQ